MKHLYTVCHFKILSCCYIHKMCKSIVELLLILYDRICGWSTYDDTSFEKYFVVLLRFLTVEK